MAYSFPNSPAIDDTFTPPGGPTWTWNGFGWALTASGGGTPAWDDITDKPATFPPTVPIAWADISGEPATFPPTLPIAQADITGLVADQSAQDTAISGKAPTVHTHAQSDITNLTTDLGLKYDKTGGMISGSVTMEAAGGFVQLAMQSNAGQNTTISFNTDTSMRWIMRKTTAAESGSNVGSDFEIVARTDAGGILSSPLVITRSTAQVNLVGDVIQTKAAPNLELRKTAGAVGRIAFRTAANHRWTLDSEGTAESGSNAGANFSIYRYTDAGALNGVAPITISRATGVVAMPLGATTLTPTAGDNTTAAATTAFVTTAIAAKIANKITVASSAPGSPATNDVWIDTT
jgi:hypothetical protein